MPRHKRKTGRISIFKGREAKLNRAIFHVLALKGSLTIYDIYKEVKVQRKLRHTSYANVNKGVRSLEKQGYTRRIGVKRTKVGFEASTYELATKAYLAMMLSSVNLEHLLKRVDDTTALAILSAIA